MMGHHASSEAFFGRTRQVSSGEQWLAHREEAEQFYGKWGSKGQDSRTDGRKSW
jgi:hypothetical protein